MGNNNATSNLTEECSKLATNGMLTLVSVPLKTTQDHVFLAGEGKYGDKQNESFSDGNIDKETPETETGSKEIAEMRSPSFSNDLRVEERRDKSMEKTQLLSQDKATLDVEVETVMLKRSETEKRRGFELSLGLSMKPTRRSDTDNSFKETKGSEDNLVDKKSNTSESLLISSVGSSKAQETTKVNDDLRTKERINESTEHILLLCQDKIEATINVEKKTVMLKRSESEKTKGFELSLGLSMKPGERSEAEDSPNIKETKDSGDNLLEKKACMKGRVGKRSKYSLFGSCLCFATAMN
ncbi:hypothetical protein Rs2_06890 [Raphanus sativus]|uniref:Uncharacterized protein LOC108818610 n=1 Tax=Raphanus sativus TaxID=3726 RepID=A0A6J0KJ15_RAPSA|nr:uncharacterized protein LOC108818610 [Raphanus sativus]KAJ4912269.1 hypothetical protein Rs2_06890 [Raphanus sativus]